MGLPPKAAQLSVYLAGEQCVATTSDLGQHEHWRGFHGGDMLMLGFLILQSRKGISAVQTIQGSAQAYERLATLTEEYGEREARLQELRVLTRALRALAVTYATEETVNQPFGQALVGMTEAAGIERNRLYQAQSRATQEMDTLNARIQNGVYNDEK